MLYQFALLAFMLAAVRAAEAPVPFPDFPGNPGFPEQPRPVPEQPQQSIPDIEIPRPDMEGGPNEGGRNRPTPYCFTYHKFIGNPAGSQIGSICLFDDGTCDFVDAGTFGLITETDNSIMKGNIGRILRELPDSRVESFQRELSKLKMYAGKCVPMRSNNCNWRSLESQSYLDNTFLPAGQFEIFGDYTLDNFNFMDFSFSVFAQVNPNGRLAFVTINDPVSAQAHDETIKAQDINIYQFAGEGWAFNIAQDSDWWFDLVCAARFNDCSSGSSKRRDFCDRVEWEDSEACIEELKTSDLANRGGRGNRGNRGNRDRTGPRI